MQGSSNPENNATSTSVQQLIDKAYQIESVGQGTSANKEYMQVLKEICDKDPINATYVTTYISLLVQSRQGGEYADPAAEGAQNEAISEAQKVFESSLRYNASQVNLWDSYLTFLQDNSQFLGADADEQIKQVFERAIQSVGKHMKAGQIWQQYINFETSQLHMGFSFLLSYVAIQTPLLDYDAQGKKFTEHLMAYKESIVEDFKKPEFASTIPGQYQEHFKKLEPMLNTQVPNVEQLSQLANQQLLKVTEQQVIERLPFEDAIHKIHAANLSLADEKKSWLSYIKFEMDKDEPVRARLLYERALISLDLDLQFWLSYVNFIQQTLKDASLVRAKFESRRSSINSQNIGDLVELMIEHAMFEEEQQQMPKARMLYETLTNEVAPGHVKATLAFIGFERRMGSNERVKELFYKAYKSSIGKKDAKAVTYIGLQYARFLAFKSNEVGRACDILDEATLAIRNYKVLYLSQANLLKHLEGLGMISGSQVETGNQGKVRNNYSSKVTEVFERALFDSELSTADKKEVGLAYIDYIKEVGSNVGQIKAVQSKLREANILQSVAQAGTASGATETQELNIPESGSILGKRQRTH